MKVLSQTKFSRISHDLSNRAGFLLFLAIGSALSACGGGDAGSAGSSGGPNDATLTWEPVIDPNLGGYRIYYGAAPGTYQQPVGSGVNVGSNVTSFTVTGLTSGSRYYFAATAVDRSDNESAFSNEVFKDIH